jgi:energy-coupling factor transporter ATP-binding protein EcfA2
MLRNRIDEPYNTKEVLDMMVIDAHKESLTFNGDILDRCLSAWSKEHQIKFLIDMRNKMHFDPNYDAEAVEREWQAIHEAAFPSDDADFIRYAISSFMWQVKRKMFNKEVYKHLMIVLEGPQGRGKSTFVKQMCSTIKEFVCETDFNQVIDDRIIDMWSNSVLFLDEMSGAGAADINKLKGIISAKTLPRRVMRTNGTVNIRQKATFIGACNRRLDQIIKDETGLRRFASLQFTATEEVWPVLSAINWPLLWSSINENIDVNPSEMIRTTLEAQQEEMRSLSAVEVWVNHLVSEYLKKKHTPEPFDSKYNKASSNEMFTAYYAWADNLYKSKMGVPYATVETFGKELKRLVKTYNDGKWPISDPYRSGGQTNYKWLGFNVDGAIDVEDNVIEISKPSKPSSGYGDDAAHLASERLRMVIAKQRGE